MSGGRPFVRQLGLQPGVQLNPIVDETDGGIVIDQSDQVIAAVARLTRGRIDIPFRVHRDNFIRRTGQAESMRVNALNEAKLQVYEALRSGAASAVLMRSVSEAAKIKYAVVNFSGTPSGTEETVAFSVSETAPTAGFSLYVRHLECFNDGIRLSVHADATPPSGTPEANKVLTLRVLDANSNLLYEITGSLDPAAVDDYGTTFYLPDVAAQLTLGLVEVFVAAGASVPVTSNAYGRTITNRPSWATSDTLFCFEEGDTVYTNADIDRFVSGLRGTTMRFGKLITGGSQNTALINALITLVEGDVANARIKIDIPGNLSPEAAIAWRNAIGTDSEYVDFNYNTVVANDPMNGGRANWGVGGLQAAFECARNARVNGRGFAPKNYAVAGREWPLNRDGMTLPRTFEDYELSDLAGAQVNPVIFATYSGGGRFIFGDSLTAYKSTKSYMKLQSVMDRAVTIDLAVSSEAFAQTQKPMKQYIREMGEFLQAYFEGAQASDWLKPATSLPGNASFQFSISPNEASPSDTVDVIYMLSYDGTVRRVMLSPKIVK